MRGDFKVGERPDVGEGGSFSTPITFTHLWGGINLGEQEKTQLPKVDKRLNTQSVEGGGGETTARGSGKNQIRHHK